MVLLFQLQGTLIGDGKPGSYLVSRHALGVVGICGGGVALTSLGGLVNLLAPALVLGNTVVLGAAEGNSLPALTLAQALLLYAPLPAGVLNVLSWGVEAPLAAHPDLAALWVGEVATQLSSPTFKRAWRIPAQCSPALCPEQWLVYQASKQKTVCL